MNGIRIAARLGADNLVANVAAMKTVGFDGVDLPIEAILSDANRARTVCGDAGLAIACGRSPLSFSDRSDLDQHAADEIQVSLDEIAAAGCGRLQINAIEPAHFNGDSSLLAFADWLLPLGDLAAERGVQIVVANVLSLRKARLMWTAIDRVRHPSVAVAWDVAAAWMAGESPGVSVPMLNYRIAHVVMSDLQKTADTWKRVPVGAGEVPLRAMMLRLRGIGYRGVVSIDVAEGAEGLTKLKGWSVEGTTKPPKAAAYKAVVKK